MMRLPHRGKPRGQDTLCHFRFLRQNPFGTLGGEQKMRRIVLAVALSVFGIMIAPAIAASPPSPQTIYSVPSVAEMEKLGEEYPSLRMVGYRAGSNQGGGYFSWNASSKAPADNCTVFPGRNSTGRWVRELPNSQLDVTMCGARWDGKTDDALAISAAFTAASRLGLSVTCPGGAGRIARTVAPGSFVGVVLRCQGMAASSIVCAVQNGPCFLFQNPNGSSEIQAPQFYDLSIAAGPAPAHPTVMIQYNRMEGGFADSAATQSYMMRPLVQRVRLEGGEIGVQCSKCFDGDMSLNLLTGQSRHGFDLEGSDWMSIGAAGTNRIVSTGDYPIKLASHGTFGNGNLVTHNDILSPKPGTGAYIYTSARTAYIEKNFLEGQTRGACEIKVDNGALHATVRDNHVTDPSVKNWLCVVPRLAQAEFTGNQTTSNGQGPAHFDDGKSSYNSVMPQTIVHFGNWSESGFP